MEIDNIAFDNRKFNDVWSRVMPNAEKPDEASRLRSFMDLEVEAVLLVAEISERCCRHIDEILCGVAECDTRHLEALRTRYFILTGERYSPPELCPVVNTALESLRTLYITKIQLTEDYRAMSSSDELYARLAEEEACTAQEIYRIIMKLLNRR